MQQQILILLLLFGIASAACTLSLTTGACTEAPPADAKRPMALITESYENHQTHSVIITTRITIKARLPNYSSTFTNASLKFYKMNGVYVSEGVCKNMPGGCKDDIVPVISNIINPPNRTCVPITDKEWEAWCWQMFNTPDKIDCAAMSKENEASMRFNMRGC